VKSTDKNAITLENRKRPDSVVEKENSKEIEITKLASGSVFGESDCLRMVGYDFLGDIYAGKDGMDCLVVQEPDLVISLFERDLLKGVLKHQHRNLIQMIETQNKYLAIHPLNKY